MKIELVTSFTLMCDGVHAGTFAHEVDALDAGVEHIKKHYPKEFKKLDREARECARSQNGWGYYDYDGKPQSKSGWVTARPDFRQAWRRTALRYRSRN